MTTYSDPATARPDNDNPNVRRVPVALIVAAWLFVGIPLVWGVSQTFIKSLDLFRSPQAQAGTGSAPAPAPTAPDQAAQPTTTPATVPST